MDYADCGTVEQDLSKTVLSVRSHEIVCGYSALLWIWVSAGRGNWSVSRDERG